MKIRNLKYEKNKQKRTLSSFSKPTACFESCQESAFATNRITRIMHFIKNYIKIRNNSPAKTHKVIIEVFIRDICPFENILRVNFIFLDQSQLFKTPDLNFLSGKGNRRFINK